MFENNETGYNVKDLGNKIGKIRGINLTEEEREVIVEFGVLTYSLTNYICALLSLKSQDPFDWFQANCRKSLFTKSKWNDSF